MAKANALTDPGEWLRAQSIKRRRLCQVCRLPPDVVEQVRVLRTKYGAGPEMISRYLTEHGHKIARSATVNHVYTHIETDKRG